MNASSQPAILKQDRWKKPPRLYEEIARDLTEAIVHGRYAPGDFLPTEQTLVKEYGASRNLIREALKVLSARGLVEVLHGKGTRVLPRYRWQLLDQLVHLLRENPRIVQNLLEVRRILEVEIAGLAAHRATAEQIHSLSQTIEQMQAASDRPEECIEHDMQFHRLLAEASGNELLPMVIEPVGELLRAARLTTIRNPGVIARSIFGHQEILAQVERRDAIAARQAMQRHLGDVEEEINRVATQQAGSPSVERSSG